MKAVKKRSFGAFLLTVAMLLCMFPHTVKAASGLQVAVSADKSQLSAGEQLQVSIRLKNNPGITSLAMSLGYDTSVLQYNDSVWSGDFSDTDMRMTYGEGGAVAISLACETPYVNNSTILTVTFTALTDSNGVPVTPSVSGVTDANAAAMPSFQLKSTIAAVTKASENAPKEEWIDDVEDEDPEVVISDEEEEKKEEEQASTKVNEPTKPVETAEGATSKSPAKTTIVKKSVTSTAAQVQKPARKVDKNYKTGVRLGNDIFLLAAAAFGMMAMLFALRSAKKQNK